MNIFRNVKFYFVVVSITAIWLMNDHFRMKTKMRENNLRIENLNKRCDSLQQEIFVLNINIGAYEVMWEKLEEVDKKLADKINNEVE